MPRSVSVLAKALDFLGFGIPEQEYYEGMESRSIADDDEGLYRLRVEQQQQQHQQQRAASTSTCPLVRAEPRDLDEAQYVADEIKREVPVILNLEECNPDEARRIRDFLGGVTYGVNGHMRKIGSWVYACSPFDMPIEKLLLDGSGLGEDRYERDDDVAESY